MMTALQVGETSITTAELLPLLASYQLMPQLLRELIIDRAISTFICTSEEIATASQQFWQQHQLSSEAEQQVWLERYGMTQTHLEAMTTRKIRIQKFKEATWGTKLESYFLKRKRQLDQVVYSLLRTSDAALAQELYFRIQGGEQTFTELAQAYSQGPEAHSGGFVGPVELGTIHPHLGHLLAMSQPGQLWVPKQLDKWWVVVRLERFVPAQMNPFMRQRLLNELFEIWVQTQVSQLPDADRLWLEPANRSHTVNLSNAA